MRELAGLIFLTGAILFAPPVLAADMDATLDRLFGAHAPYEKFLTKLKLEAKAQDWSTIADQLSYPLTVRISGRRLKFEARGQFLSHVRSILTPRVLQAIAAQRYEDLFANANGVMIGNGEIWYSGICAGADCNDAPIKITAIKP